MSEDKKASMSELIDRIVDGAKIIGFINNEDVAEEADELGKANAKAMLTYLKDVCDAATELVERVNIRVAVDEGRLEGSLETLADMRPKR